MKQGARTYHSDASEKPPFILYLSLFFLLVCINALAAKYFVFSYPIVPGVSSFYLVVACMIAFALWFGMWGVLAAYVGCVIGAGVLSGLPIEVALYWSVADLWQAWIPYVAFRYFHADPALRTWHDFRAYLIFGVILNNVAGAVWGSYTLVYGGIIDPEQVSMVLTGWLLGNVVVCVLLTPLLLVFITPWIKTHELYAGWREN